MNTSKNKYRLTGLLLSGGLWASAQNVADKAIFNGDQLFSTVKTYVAKGEHRTGTPGDFATSAWLADELKQAGYTVRYHEFPLKQFFLEKAAVTEGSHAYDAFPLWYVSETIPSEVTGVVTTEGEDVKGKVVLLRFSGQGGQTEKETAQKLRELVDKGAKAIIGYSENKVGEIVAYNAPKVPQPWKVPVVVVAPATAKALAARKGQQVRVSVKGTFKEITARNVYGTIGNGKEYVVVSTPISGWFGCGGERGPGLAAWLALAQWAAASKLPYTFVFTGNSGHELGGLGAHAFLDHGAPPVEKTKLWIHLGAAIATLSYHATPSGLAADNKVDDQRNFYYSSSVQKSFTAAFAPVPGLKFDTKQRAGGELVYVIDKGYPNVAGAAYSHPYFHTKGDTPATTSPALLQEVSLAFKTFLENELAPRQVAQH
ncbi:PA domain-containing protein [Paraflavisolibacter sp. H34]|uniref:PA domain-containing protein n=1 Tax=Huijunlia imazamoxiresistens TaxID=3127457 RepID=UPI00301B4C4E